MTTRTTLKIGLALVTVAGLVTLIFVRNGSFAEAAYAQSPVQINSRAAREEAKVQYAPLNRVADHRGLYLQGDTYETLSSRLKARAKDDPDARALLADASAQCENLGRPPSSSRPVDASTREYRAWRLRFCGHARDMDATSYRLSHTDLGEVRKLVNDDGGLIAGRSKEAIDIVLHSTFYSDIEAAGQYLMHTPDADWDLGKDAVAGTAMAGKLRELQQVAVESVACSYSGTCEAGGLKTMQVCAMRRVCAPGITLYDVWDMIYSPQEMAVVAAMQRALLDQRRSERTP